MRTIVISPHPDDESFGAGGTLLRLKSEGHQIYWLNITNMAEEFGFTKEQIALRDKEIRQVIKEFDFDGTFDLGLKPSGLDTYPASILVGKIREVFEKIKPELVILPFKNDIYSDHRLVTRAAISCTKSFRFPTIKKIMMMEVLSETDFALPDEAFSPNIFYDITPFLDKKLKIIETYKGEIGQHPFPRSCETAKALSVYRGGQAGYKFAESFCLIKEII